MCWSNELPYLTAGQISIMDPLEGFEQSDEGRRFLESEIDRKSLEIHMFQKEIDGNQLKINFLLKKKNDNYQETVGKSGGKPLPQVQGNFRQMIQLQDEIDAKVQALERDILVVESRLEDSYNTLFHLEGELHILE